MRLPRPGMRDVNGGKTGQQSSRVLSGSCYFILQSAQEDEESLEGRRTSSPDNLKAKTTHTHTHRAPLPPAPFPPSLSRCLQSHFMKACETAAKDFKDQSVIPLPTMHFPSVFLDTFLLKKREKKKKTVHAPLLKKLLIGFVNLCLLHQLNC